MVAPLQAFQLTDCIQTALTNAGPRKCSGRTRPLREGLPLMQRSISLANSSDVQHFNLQFAAAGNRLMEPNELPNWLRTEKKRSLKPSPLWSDQQKTAQKIGACGSVTIARST